MFYVVYSSLNQYDEVVPKHKYIVMMSTAIVVILNVTEMYACKWLVTCFVEICTSASDIEDAVMVN